MTDWNHFFGSLRKYVDYFRAHLVPKFGGVSATASGSSQSTQTISDGELAGLLSWTRFATAIAQKDPESRRQIYEERNWNCVETSVGLLACSIPLVLKQALYEFLAALAIDEIAAVNIWNCLLCEGICVQRMTVDKLVGIQQDLEEESQLKVYNCTRGFLTLLKKLLSHKTRPGTHQVAPYIQFIVHSVLCQFSTRSYVNSNQMWKIVELALDSLYEPLRTFYATPVVVQNKSIEVQILAQLLSDSPLSRSLLQIIVEGADRLHDDLPPNPSRDDATFSAIRLLYMALSHRSAMADAIRSVNSDLLIVSLESILFSSIPHPQRANLNYLSLLFQYLSEYQHLAKHSFYVLLIIKEAAAQRPSLQSCIVQSLLPRRAQLIVSMANLSSVFSFQSITISITDLLPQSLDDIAPDRLRGELCRLLFELFNDSMESEPGKPNVAYALMNFDLNSIQSTVLDIPNEVGEGLTSLHNLIYIAEQLAMSERPYSHQFSGLYEPVLRLLLRLCSVRAKSSALLLRFLRSQYDLIYRLASSETFLSIDLPPQHLASPIFNSPTFSNIIRNNGSETTFQVVHKSLQGVLLELIALEMSSLLRTGHIEQPHRFLKLLLSNEKKPNSTNALLHASASGLVSVDEPQKALLWDLLDASRTCVEDLSIPNCVKFDTQKVLELLNLCVRKNSYGIEQYDVLYLHLLLNSEINCIMNTEIGVIRAEARAILDYCVRRNARNLLEGACVHLLEGWLSMVNVLSIHVPLPFIDTRLHQCLLVDALFLLREYCHCVEMSAELAASVAACITRIIRAICGIFANGVHRPTLCHIRQSMLPILHLLLQIIVLPGYSKSVAFKTELYANCLRVLDICNPPQNAVANDRKTLPDGFKPDIKTLCDFIVAKVGSSEQKRNAKINGHIEDPVVAMITESSIVSEQWINLFDPITHEIVQTLSSDIMFAPLSLKLLTTATFIDVLREDIRHEGRMVREFVYNGFLQCVEDALARIEQAEKGKEPQSNMLDASNRSSGSLTRALKSLIAMAKACARSSVILQ